MHLVSTTYKMSKTNPTQKRNKERFQIKRPKLEFCDKNLPSFSNDSKNTHVSNKNYSLPETTGSNSSQNGAISNDWDDEFSSDMLEEVCLIADLSQAMANSESKAAEPNTVIHHKGLKRTVSERNMLENSSEVLDEISKLRLENEKLRENIKTKEGEVQILRSQLKQNQLAKQNETLNNIKLIEEMQMSYKEKLEITQKEFNATKTELQFKDLELKSLTERCKRLESTTSKTRIIEPQLASYESKRSNFNSSLKLGKGRFKDCSAANIKPELGEKPLTFQFPKVIQHEGQKFGNILCPEFFNLIDEPSVIPLYTFNKGYGFHVSSLDFDKREKYKWSGLPQQTVFVKDLHNSVTQLFLYENFDEKAAQKLIENILNVSIQILNSQKDLLLFLERLQEKNSEFDDSDYTLLENEERVEPITVKDLLDGRKINNEECGIEARRTLAMLLSLIMSSKSAQTLLFAKADFENILKDLATSIGNLRRPVRYTGILTGITFILAQFLGTNDLKRELLTTLREITEEIIFARPKLDVLVHVIEVLAVGRIHIDFVQALCRRGSVESCALYMDSKLQQAMFFTKDACPLKLLCTQIMGLSCIPVNREMKWIVTNSVIRWLNVTMDTLFSREIKWLPNSSLTENEDSCFDIMECFMYLLNSCLKDLILMFSMKQTNSFEGNDTTFHIGKSEYNLLSIVGDGCVLFHRILKHDQRLLLESSHNLRFATQLTSLNFHKSFHPHQREAVAWITEVLENELKAQESCMKKDVHNFSTTSVIEALKIKDNLIIF